MQVTRRTGSHCHDRDRDRNHHHHGHTAATTVMENRRATMPLMLSAVECDGQTYRKDRENKYGAPPIKVNIAYRFTTGTPLPAWLWEEKVPCFGSWVLIWPGNKAAFMWWSNVACALFHLGLAATTVGFATSNSTGLDTPGMTVYTTNLKWGYNQSRLVPENEEADQPLLLSHMTLWFFLLSFFAHFAIVVGNWRQALYGHKSCEMREATRFTGWYFVWLHECRQPLRYAASAARAKNAFLRPENQIACVCVCVCARVLSTGGLSIPSAPVS